jgi:hypothetical protein
MVRSGSLDDIASRRELQHRPARDRNDQATSAVIVGDVSMALVTIDTGRR